MVCAFRQNRTTTDLPTCTEMKCIGEDLIRFPQCVYWHAYVYALKPELFPLTPNGTR
jgi:hypothetical protein